MVMRGSLSRLFAYILGQGIGYAIDVIIFVVLKEIVDLKFDNNSTYVW